MPIINFGGHIVPMGLKGLKSIRTRRFSLGTLSYYWRLGLRIKLYLISVPAASKLCNLPSFLDVLVPEAEIVLLRL